MKFELGRVLVTIGINETLQKNELFQAEIAESLNKYINCDWGILCEEDSKMNDDAVSSGDDRIFAAYETSEGKIWIITEWDRSATTIMFPNEY